MLPVKLHASAALIKSNLQLKRLIRQDVLHNRNFPQTLLKEVQCEYTVGMPNGLFSSLPGLGIHTRLVGLTFEPNFNLATKVNRCFGVSVFTPSTPAVLSGKKAHVAVSSSPKNRT